MRILSGIDIVEIDRIGKSIDRQGDAFINRVFTHDEQEYCNRLTGIRRMESYAARFAAKEAAGKALGTGIMAEGISLTDIGIINDVKGAPRLSLTGKARQKADDYGVFDMSLSLSHDGGYAIAVCSMLAEGGEPS